MSNELLILYDIQYVNLYYRCIELTLRTDKKRMESDLVTMTKHLASCRSLLTDYPTVQLYSLSLSVPLCQHFSLEQNLLTGLCS